MEDLEKRQWCESSKVDELDKGCTIACGIDTCDICMNRNLQDHTRSFLAVNSGPDGHSTPLVKRRRNTGGTGEVDEPPTIPRKRACHEQRGLDLMREVTGLSTTEDTAEFHKSGWPDEVQDDFKEVQSPFPHRCPEHCSADLPECEGEYLLTAHSVAGTVEEPPLADFEDLEFQAQTPQQWVAEIEAGYWDGKCQRWLAEQCLNEALEDSGIGPCSRSGVEPSTPVDSIEGASNSSPSDNPTVEEKV
ncbi:hypothetical protein MMC19_004488 [Ptychographa xylographoides]|nr:hypothetical protein [Ptychographa xylographoides]